jgi:hypothetical protein
MEYIRVKGLWKEPLAVQPTEEKKKSKIVEKCVISSVSSLVLL